MFRLFECIIYLCGFSFRLTSFEPITIFSIHYRYFFLFCKYTSFALIPHYFNFHSFYMKQVIQVHFYFKHFIVLILFFINVRIIFKLQVKIFATLIMGHLKLEYRKRHFFFYLSLIDHNKLRQFHRIINDFSIKSSKIVVITYIFSIKLFRL